MNVYFLHIPGPKHSSRKVDEAVLAKAYNILIDNDVDAASIKFLEREYGSYCVLWVTYTFTPEKLLEQLNPILNESNG